MRLRVKYNSYGDFSGNLKSLPVPWTQDGSEDKKAKGLRRLYPSCQGTAGMCAGP